LKLVAASLVIFSLVILFLFALFPSDISISRLTQINSPQDSVRKKIADLRAWKTWNEMMLSQFSGVNPNYRLDSAIEKNSNVSIEILSAGNDTILSRWTNGHRSFTGNYILTRMNGQTVVEWTLHFHIRWYPWEKLASMFYDKQLGTMMENSLLKLKNELEVH
jgi:hypothetical protein